MPEAIVVERNATPVIALHPVTVEYVRREANGVGGCLISIPLRPSAPAFAASWIDPAVTLDGVRGLLLKREIQIREGPKCRWWGVPVRAWAEGSQLKIQCMGLLWYFLRRYYGPIQQELLLNRNFADATLSPWVAVNATASQDTAYPVMPPKSAKLVGTDAADGYLYQRVTVTTSADQPRFHAVKAWYRVDSAGYVGHGFEERGLTVVRRATDLTILETSEPQAITNGSPKDKWERLESGMSVPAGVTQVVETRLQKVHGTLRWGATSMRTEESVGADADGDDATTVTQRVVAYAQDAAQGKSDLNIGFAGALSGKSLERHFQFMDDGNIGESFSEFPESETFDFDIVWDSGGTAKTFTVYPPRRGTRKADLSLVMGPEVQVAGYEVDGQQTATATRILGRGEGADREVGKASDASLLGGLILEAVETAPQEATIDTLDSLAVQRLSKTKRLTVMPNFVVRAKGARVLLDAVELGDTLPGYVRDGWIRESGDFRVESLEWVPPTDLLNIGVSPE